MISVVMPAHNEQGFLEPAATRVVTAMRDRGRRFEVIISENGSTDGTRSEAKELVNRFREVSVITSPNADYGVALRDGFLAAAGELVVNMDVDFIDLDFLDRAVKLLDSTDVTIVVGSKRTPGAQDHRNLARRTITSVFTLVLKAGFGLKISDTHGLKALRRQPLIPLVKTARFGKDIFDTELILRAERAGFTVDEVPVVVEDSRPPRSSILARIPRTLLGLARLRVALGMEGFKRFNDRVATP